MPSPFSRLLAPAAVVVLSNLAPLAAADAKLLEILSTPSGFDRFSQAEAVLIASGAESPALLRRYTKKLQSVVDSIAAAAVAQTATADLALAVHQQMHKQVLAHYDAGLGDIRITLDTGVYNCVTGTVIYVLAARKAGLLSSPYAMNGHVLPVVFDTEGARFLEATDPKAEPSRTWWQPLANYRNDLKDIHDALKPLIGKAQHSIAEMQLIGEEESARQLQEKVEGLVVAAEAKAKARYEESKKSGHDIDSRAMAALFLWNRSITAAERGQRGEAIRLLKGLFRLGGHALPDKLRQIRLLELGSLLVEQGERDGWKNSLKTVDLLLSSSEHSMDKLMLRDLRADVYVRWASAAKGRPAAACQILKRGHAADPDHPLLAQLASPMPKSCEQASWK